MRERVLRAGHGMGMVDFDELWRYRELFGFLIWRDIIVRYKQAVLGITWAVLQPVLTVAIFTFILGYLAKIPSGGQPYVVLAMAGLLPWNYFAAAMGESSNSVVGAARIITKVYFPRLIIPLSTAMNGILDFCIGCGLLFTLMLWNAVPFTWYLLLIPPFFVCAVIAAMAIGLWMSALSVRFRDVKYIVPFFTRIGIYASPVAFSSALVPEKWRLLYSLNPMVGVIDGFRWAVFGAEFQPYWPGFALSMGIVVLLFVSGMYFFKTMERSFGDLI